MELRPPTTRGAAAARETTVCSRGLRLFVREQGDGHPLLLLNGIGANADMWGPAERILAEGSRTIALDCPGTGCSDTPLFPLPMPSLARVVWGAIDRLGYERVDVLGFSFGGAIAQQLARESPGRIRRLALVSTGCGWGSTIGSLSAVTAVAVPLRYYSPSWCSLTEPMLGEPLADGDVDAEPARSSHLPTPLGYTYQLWALAGWSSLGWLSDVDVPTLVASGGDDRLIPAHNAVQLARLLPNSRLQLLPAAPHQLMSYRRGTASRLLADFFAAPSLAQSTAWTTGIPCGDNVWESAA